MPVMTTTSATNATASDVNNTRSATRGPGQTKPAGRNLSRANGCQPNVGDKRDVGKRGPCDLYDAERFRPEPARHQR